MKKSTEDELHLIKNRIITTLRKNYCSCWMTLDKGQGLVLNEEKLEKIFNLLGKNGKIRIRGYEKESNVITLYVESKKYR